MSPAGRRASARTLLSSHSKASTSKLAGSGSSPIKVNHGRLVPRRSPPSISTNLNTYDKKDPFQAFTTLFSLISTLTGRIGGAQFKLTPEEQKLAVHLLGIIEPFIGSTPSRRTHLTRQPTEILDYIVSHVDSKHDLLNLALTCQRMHSVVIPRHFDYRVVRAKVSSISVWNHLIVNRSLAKNVRQLEILDERAPATKEIVPAGIIASDTDLESTDDELTMHVKQERYVLQALGRMTTLVYFKWSCNHSPLSIEDMWPALLRCQTLKEVEINDNLVFAPFGSAQGQEEPSEESNSDEERVEAAIVLPELTKITLSSTKHSYGAARHPSLSRVKGMLNSCPNLECLAISYTAPRSRNAVSNGFPSYLPADDIFLFGRWTNLRFLALTNLRVSASTNSNRNVGTDAVTTFLLAHANVEVLVLDIANLSGSVGESNDEPLTFLPNTLPRLREITANREIVSSLLACPLESDISRPLEVIRGVRLTGAHYSQVDAGIGSTSTRCPPQGLPNDPNRNFLYNLKTYGTNVKRIELANWVEMEDVRRLIEYAPKGLTWLDLGKRLSGTASGNPLSTGPSARAINTNAVEWATLLSALPELTTFHGIKFFYEVSTLPNPMSYSPYASTGVPEVNHANHLSSSIPLSEPSGSDKSRIRKNDENASMLAWKCPKLRRVDHWEDESETKKVIVLVKEGSHGKGKDKVRWEVRRVKQ
ncbi:hypothetical protein K435DRAFT_838748 [Dendrothele bispora CBS 962.96]|uniref:F-box domain-containing protein n=1 Tax=Dendrothele bispora (strain CBS 962.96) TaxID=1314807 RepID=A0A4S8M4L8_DENBC|nr:hypothetical protein K435DRAFT_838748 [Dendrothele bispora CBS 962.96]